MTTIEDRMTAGVTMREQDCSSPDVAAAVCERALLGYARARNVPAVAGLLCAYFSAQEVDELVARLLVLQAHAEAPPRRQVAVTQTAPAQMQQRERED